MIGKLSSIINCRSAFSPYPSNHHLVILGNFNARVSQALPCNNAWSITHGGYGIGEENESGVELLNYLEQILLLKIPSFRKREIHLQTWQHPRSKLWHCIDLVIVQRRWLYLISDCHVIRLAECYSNHKLVCLTYNLTLLIAKRQPLC